MTCRSQSSRLNYPDYIRWSVQTMKFLIAESSPLPFRILLGPNIRLRILFSNNLSMRSLFNVREYVLQPYHTTGNIILLYILIFKFLERSWEDKRVWNDFPFHCCTMFAELGMLRILTFLDRLLRLYLFWEKGKSKEIERKRQWVSEVSLNIYGMYGVF